MKTDITAIMITALILALSACGNNPSAKDKSAENNRPATNGIVRVGYKHYGGMGGLSVTLSITQSSTLYSYSLFIDSSNNRRYDEPTEEQTWAKLMDELDVEAFKKIENGPSYLPVDGTDREFFIATESGQEFMFINGEEDEHFKKLQPFFNHLLAIHNACSEQPS